MTSVGLALLAGVLSLLSPCVLPIVPIVLGAAASEHRLGPAALAAGLALSFTAIGLFVATIGFSIGLDGGVFRIAAALVLAGLGLALAIPAIGARLAVATGPVGAWTETRLGGFSTAGLTGQFGVGLLLGAVWSPCVGPTLGAASVLAARAEQLEGVALTMAAFGIGAALPLGLLGLASRRTLLGWRGRLASAGGGIKQALGLVLVAAALLILTGLDKRAETALVDASPPWLTDLTTRF